MSQNFQERIDVHAHYLPPAYRAAARAAGHGQPDGMPALPQWSEDAALAQMDQLGVRKAFLSISSPGVHFGDDAAARQLARTVNEEGSRLKAQYPERFGFYAALPLPDFDGALAELRYAFDVLHADAVVFETNANGVYLGDERLDQLFAELNQRGAVAFIHPTSPSCSCCTDLALGYPRPILEFLFETTRSVTNLVLRGITTRFPRVRIIVPHAGAALPIVVDRVAGFAGLLGLTPVPTEVDLLAAFRSLYYDLAGFPLPRLLPTLLTMADPTHILYGSDTPFTPAPLVAQLAAKLDAGLTPEQLAAFMNGNARQLFALPASLPRG